MTLHINDPSKLARSLLSRGSLVQSIEFVRKDGGLTTACNSPSKLACVPLWDKG